MIHLFKQEQLLGVELPLRFTYPFCYTPHPLCEIAALETQKYIQKRDDWADELKQGKMFGVLVVQTPQKDIGFLAAFSGLLCGSNRHDYFVPPVYDLLSPDSFFKKEEKKISSMSKQIEKMKAKMLPYENKMEAKLEQMRKKAETELLAFKENMNLAKEQRSRRRAEGDLSEKENIEDSNFLRHYQVTVFSRRAFTVRLTITEKKPEYAVFLIAEDGWLTAYTGDRTAVYEELHIALRSQEVPQ